MKELTTWEDGFRRTEIVDQAVIDRLLRKAETPEQRFRRLVDEEGCGAFMAEVTRIFSATGE